MENIPLIEKVIEYKTRLTRQELLTMNDHYMRFVGYNTCNQLIWTNGFNFTNSDKMKCGNKKKMFWLY